MPQSFLTLWPLDVFPDSELTTIPHPCTKGGAQGTCGVPQAVPGKADLELEEQ